MFCFPKKERLSEQKRIESLFSKGKAFLCYPFSVRYTKAEGKGNISVLIVCSKRYQRKAVNRNYIKRRMREAFRLNNQFLKSYIKENNIYLDFSLSYISKEIFNYQQIEDKIKEILVILQKEVQQ